MMMFVPADSVGTAESVSSAIYRLSRPNPDPRDCTQYACSWHVHPETGAVLLDFYGVPPLPVAQQIIEDGLLAQVLDGFVQSGHMTDEDRLAVLDKATQAVGTCAEIIDFIPPALASQALTREQAEAAGWFPAPADL